MGIPLYVQRLEGEWGYVDLPLDEARELVGLLFERGAGFICTSEAGPRRVYIASETSKAVTERYLASLSPKRLN